MIMKSSLNYVFYQIKCDHAGKVYNNSNLPSHRNDNGTEIWRAGRNYLGSEWVEEHSRQRKKHMQRSYLGWRNDILEKSKWKLWLIREWNTFLDIIWGWRGRVGSYHAGSYSNVKNFILYSKNNWVLSKILRQKSDSFTGISGKKSLASLRRIGYRK